MSAFYFFHNLNVIE